MDRETLRNLIESILRHDQMARDYQARSPEYAIGGPSPEPLRWESVKDLPVDPVELKGQTAPDLIDLILYMASRNSTVHRNQPWGFVKPMMRY